jgi:hypothetical protein
MMIEVRYQRITANEALFCIGFQDEGEREIGAAISPLMPLANAEGVVQCTIDPLPFQPGIYFPVVAILSPDGKIEDRWKLGRAVVVDGDGQMAVIDQFGPLRIPAQWSGV